MNLDELVGQFVTTADVKLTFAQTVPLPVGAKDFNIGSVCSSDTHNNFRSFQFRSIWSQILKISIRLIFGLSNLIGYDMCAELILS